MQQQQHQQRPLFPDDDDDDDFDDLDDLQFVSAVDTNTAETGPSFQNVLPDPEKGGVNAMTGQVKTSKMEPLELESPEQLGIAAPVAVPQEQPPVPQESSAEAFASNMSGSVRQTLSESRLGQLLRESAHPIPCVFHCLFKSLALFMYIFGGWFAGASNFVTITVICIILLSFDFWVVKNITGRLLVGLRWWNKVEEDGSTQWIFESAEKTSRNAFDNTLFWGVNYGTPLVWGGLFFIGLLKLELGWLIVVSVALVLSCSNVYGYWKCSSDQKVKFEQMIAQGAQMGVSSAIQHNVMGRISQLAAARNNAGAAQQQQGRPGGMTFA